MRTLLNLAKWLIIGIVVGPLVVVGFAISWMVAGILSVAFLVLALIFWFIRNIL